MSQSICGSHRNAYIMVPCHCSSLQSLSKFQLSLRNKHSETENSNTFVSKSILLVIQCHGEGRMFWNGLLPILESSCFSFHDENDTFQYTSSLAVSILRNHFQSNVESIQTMIKTEDDFESTTSQGFDSYQTKYEYTKGNDLHLYLIILPPFPCPYSYSSRKTNLRPERVFTPHLIRLENYYIKLQTLNAYLSTMGGGYFLCRYLDTAIQIARQQRRVALAMGDLNLALKCTVNEAYNWIHVGKVNKALRILNWIEVQVKKQIVSSLYSSPSNMDMDMEHISSMTYHTISKDVNCDPEFIILLKMCESAKLFGQRVKKAKKLHDEVVGGNVKSRMRRLEELQMLHVRNHKQEIASCGHIPGTSSILDTFHDNRAKTQKRKISLYTATHDDFNRIRILNSYKK